MTERTCGILGPFPGDASSGHQARLQDHAGAPTSDQREARGSTSPAVRPGDLDLDGDRDGAIAARSVPLGQVRLHRQPGAAVWLGSAKVRHQTATPRLDYAKMQRPGRPTELT
jgi:hypothetical protein